MEYFEHQHSTKAVRKFNPINSLSLRTERQGSYEVSSVTIFFNA